MGSAFRTLRLPGAAPWSWHPAQVTHSWILLWPAVHELLQSGARHPCGPSLMKTSHTLHVAHLGSPRTLSKPTLRSPPALLSAQPLI